jgi:hypothetical protein
VRAGPQIDQQAVYGSFPSRWMTAVASFEALMVFVATRGK